MKTELNVLALSGSLRRGSYNTAALRAARELAPAGMRIEGEVALLHGIPLFDADLEAEGVPEAVAAIGARIRAADALLIAVPEYNYAMTGVLKNALDWLSRPEGKAPLTGKPLAMIGASTSTIGTARAQSSLRDVAYYNAMPLFASAEVLIGRAHEKFDEEMRLTDPTSREKLAALLAGFLAFARKVLSTS